MATRIEGSLIALRLPAGPRFVAALDDAWSRGDAVLPIPPSMPQDETRRWMEAFRPAALVEPSGVTALAGAEPVRPGTALVIATSGSTGLPKGVVLSHQALDASARASVDRLGARAGDRWVCCLPLHHVAGLQVLRRARLLGPDPILYDRFEPERLAAAPGGAFVPLVPTMLKRLLDVGVDVARFGCILLGGAAATPGLLERAAAAGARVVTSYGMTETCGGCVYDGMPLEGVDVRVGRTGRVQVRGAVLFDGYRRQGARRDEWFDTADRGVLHGGRLRVLGRVDDVIVTGGEKVAPDEIAALLASHPAIAEAAVIGRPDPDWGQRVVAYVTLAGSQRAPTLAEVRAFVASRAARHKAPRELRVLDALPRTPLGKVDAARLG